MALWNRPNYALKCCHCYLSGLWSKVQMIFTLSSWCRWNPVISCFIKMLNAFPFCCQVLMEQMPRALTRIPRQVESETSEYAVGRCAWNYETYWLTEHWQSVLNQIVSLGLVLHPKMTLHDFCFRRSAGDYVEKAQSCQNMVVLSTLYFYY